MHEEWESGLEICNLCPLSSAEIKRKQFHPAYVESWIIKAPCSPWHSASFRW